MTMENHEIRNRAQSMAKEIQGIVDSYNRIDPAFSFYPIITMTETDTATGSVKGVSVDVQVVYNTKDDQTPFGYRQFTQVDTSINAHMEGKP